MSQEQLDAIRNQLQLEENYDIRSRIYMKFLEDQEEGANMIIEFARVECGIKANAKDVIHYLENFDDEEVDVEMTPEVLASLSGGSKCS